MAVYRIYVEKSPDYAVEAQGAFEGDPAHFCASRA